jgi:hypothetical protein
MTLDLAVNANCSTMILCCVVTVVVYILFHYQKLDGILSDRPATGPRTQGDPRQAPASSFDGYPS